MRSFLHWFNAPQEAGAIVRASIAHLWFETLVGVIEKDPGSGGRSTRYRIRLGEERPILLVKDMSWS